MPSHTRFLSRLIGAYSILIPLSMAAHKQATVETVTALMQNPALVFLFGLMAVATGLALVLGHNVWSGGALPGICLTAMSVASKERSAA